MRNPEPKERKPSEWERIALSIGTMSRSELLALRCPDCGAGILVAYGETEGYLKNYLAVRCSQCHAGINMDGLGEPPSFISELPWSFEITSDGTFQVIKAAPKPVQKYTVGDLVIVCAPTHKCFRMQGTVRSVVWNFSKDCWDYLLLSNGTQIPHRFKEFELETG